MSRKSGKKVLKTSVLALGMMASGLTLTQMADTPMIAYAAEININSEAGLYDADGNMTYTWQELIDNGKVVVTDGVLSAGTGLKSLIGTFVIDDSVTSIADNTFWKAAISKVVVPDSVETIGSNAFYMCKSLTAIEMSEGLKAIGNSAFYQCTNLTELDLPASVETVGGRLIYGCTSLQKLVINGDIIFSSSLWGDDYCYLKEVELNNISVFPTYKPTSTTTKSIFTWQTYDKYALKSLQSVKITGTLTSIPAYAFNGKLTGLTNLTLPETVTEIGKSAFSGCSALTNIDLPEGLTTIGESAFSGTGLTSIDIPDTVTEIGESAFGNTTALESVTIPGTVNSMGTKVFAGSYVKEVTLEDGITEIGYNVFENATYLEIVNLPNTLTTISSKAFSGCTALENIIFPESLTTIGQEAFDNCVSLKEITIPVSVTELNMCAFRNCTALEKVIFDGCVGFTHHYSGNDNDVFVGCTNVKTVVFNDELGEFSSGNPASMTPSKGLGAAGLDYVEEVIINSNISSIPEGMFSNLGYLTKVTFNGYSDSIDFGVDAFYVSTETPTQVTFDARQTDILEYDWAGDNRTVTFYDLNGSEVETEQTAEIISESGEFYTTVGGTLKLSANVSDQSETYKWVYANIDPAETEQVISMTEDGTITGLKEGWVAVSLVDSTNTIVAQTTVAIIGESDVYGEWYGNNGTTSNGSSVSAGKNYGYVYGGYTYGGGSYYGSYGGSIIGGSTGGWSTGTVSGSSFGTYVGGGTGGTGGSTGGTGGTGGTSGTGGTGGTGGSTGDGTGSGSTGSGSTEGSINSSTGTGSDGYIGKDPAGLDYSSADHQAYAIEVGQTFLFKAFDSDTSESYSWVVRNYALADDSKPAANLMAVGSTAGATTSGMAYARGLEEGWIELALADSTGKVLVCVDVAVVPVGTEDVIVWEETPGNEGYYLDKEEVVFTSSEVTPGTADNNGNFSDSISDEDIEAVNTHLGLGNLTVTGTASAITTMDITIPLDGLTFAIDEKRDFIGNVTEVTSYCNFPVDMYFLNIEGSADTDIVEPALVENKYTDYEWNNMKVRQTLAEMHLNINENDISAIYGNDDLDATKAIKMGEFKSAFENVNGESIELQPTSAKYGKAFGNSDILTLKYDVLVEFIIP